MSDINIINLLFKTINNDNMSINTSKSDSILTVKNKIIDKYKIRYCDYNNIKLI